MNSKIPIEIEALKSYADYERQITINHLKIGCYLVMTLMPLGAVLDFFVYPKEVRFFFLLRLFCAALAAVVWGILRTPISKKIHWALSLLIAMLPSFFICWMIYTTDGLDSPYYAGLNLVLLSIALVMRWTVTLSIAASLSVISMYLAACFFRGTITQEHGGDFVNNLYFLALTAVIVIIGGHLHRVLRLREFTLRYELDRNRTALEESNRKLIELDRLKSRFFANISHEMRTPLALLLSPLETLLQRYHHHLDDSVREKLVMMQSNGMRLLKLINDLLELIRLEAGRLEIKSEPLAVNEFVAGLASAIRQLAENKRIHVETRVAKDVAAVLTDRDKLEKILLNLLFNSLKFTPEKGTVSLRAERQGDQFVLIVSDTGVGIAEKNLPFVFDRFWQADTSSKRKFQGVGIGLALVKELSEMMGGGVTVQSQEGKGAAFTVKLPYRAAELPAKREIPEPVPAADGAEHTEEWLANLYRRAEFFPALAAGRATSRISAATGSRPVVLIADDEPDMRNYLRTELEEDYDVIEAVNGTEAFEKAEQFRPDIALLDVMMPEMDGLEVCRKMRERENTVNIPVILLTARADEETKFDALQIGANDFLPKPFSSNELQARVRNLIETHYYHRKLTKQNVALKSAIEQIKETETQLVQSEKLASLGRLSAGIIHEINNPLNFSLTGLYTLRNKGKKMQMTGKEREEYEAVLNDVEEGLKRVRNIVSDLRAFTHPGGAIGEPLEAADAVNAALRFLSGEWKNKVHIEQNVPPEQLIWANRNQVIHVLVNLIQNSIDALAEKKFEGDEKPTIYISGCVEGERSLIFVRDNGAGIDPKIADKIFDPFFTTKEVGKGMGLGLSICYRIMHGYGGNISVKTEQGRFTEFALNFWLKAPPEVALDTEIENGQPLRL